MDGFFYKLCKFFQIIPCAYWCVMIKYNKRNKGKNMRRLLILPLIAMFCVSDSVSFAGPRGRGGASGGASAGATGGGQKAGVAARAAKKSGPVKPTPSANGGSKTPQANGGTNTSGGKTTGGKTATGGAKPNGARAAATQKVVQTGTKVASATANTNIPQECQDAFYGCMDSFCMLDNASGGRCQCSDKGKELDAVMAEIIRLDEQSYAMATEGVERLQMGDNADEIIARAKAAADQVSEKKVAEKKEESKKKVRQLDLSAWDNASFEDDDDDVFGEQKKDDDYGKLVDTFADKTGNELYTAAAKMCVDQVPDNCTKSASMLQLVYAQRIKSDCMAYENSLKKQKSESAKKLQTAQKALRDTALENFENENKYADLGSCVIAFDTCMQNTAGCGKDYAGCVADPSVLQVLYGTGSNGGKKVTKNKSKAKGADAELSVATIDINTGASVVTISSASYDVLKNKSVMCESVVKQCVNSNGGKTVAGGKVLEQFLKNVALTIYNAEYNTASNARMNCISTIVNCVKKSCKSEGFEEGSTNYDACLSNPDSVKNYCKLEINRCGDTMSQNDVVSYVIAKLAADRVDACTKEVKDCLLSEDRCGPDYAGCLGLDTDTIMDLCPPQKLMACQDKHNANADAVRDYVASVAQGLALNMDNAFAATCQNAANEAMNKICGDTEDCPNANKDANLGKATLTYQICKVGVSGSGSSESMVRNLDACKSSITEIHKDEWGKDKLTVQDINKIGSISSGYSSDSSWGFFLIAGGGSSSEDSQTQINMIQSVHYGVEEAAKVNWFYSPYISGKIDFGQSVAIEDNAEGKAVFVNLLETTSKDTGGNQVSSCPTASDKETPAEKEKREKCENVKVVVAAMNKALNNVMAQIDADPTVSKCVNGNDFQGISGSSTRNANKAKAKSARDSTKIESEGRYKNLTASVRYIVAGSIYNYALTNYNTELLSLKSRSEQDGAEISQMYESILDEKDETARDARKGQVCNSYNADNSTWNYKEVIKGIYSEEKNTCTKTIRTQTCKKTLYASRPGKRTCTEWNAVSESSQVIQM